MSEIKKVKSIEVKRVGLNPIAVVLDINFKKAIKKVADSRGFSISNLVRYSIYKTFKKELEAEGIDVKHGLLEIKDAVNYPTFRKALLRGREISRQEKAEMKKKQEAEKAKKQKAKEAEKEKEQKTAKVKKKVE